MGPASMYFREHSLKRDLSNDTTFNPPLFSLVNTLRYSICQGSRPFFPFGIFVNDTEKKRPCYASIRFVRSVSIRGGIRVLGELSKKWKKCLHCVERLYCKRPILCLASSKYIDPHLGCALTFALEAKFEIEAKISFRFEAKKKPDFTWFTSMWNTKNLKQN